jgi:hypothetical protein
MAAALLCQLGQPSPEPRNRLADALLVLDQREAHVPVA